MTFWSTIRDRTATAINNLATDGLMWRRPPQTAWTSLTALILVARTGPWIQDSGRQQQVQPQEAQLWVAEGGTQLDENDQVLVTTCDVPAQVQVWTVLANAVQASGKTQYSLKFQGVLRAKPDRHNAP